MALRSCHLITGCGLFAVVGASSSRRPRLSSGFFIVWPHAKPHATPLLQTRVQPVNHILAPDIIPELRPPPERAGELLPGSDDRKWIFASIFAALKIKTVAAAA